MTKMKKFDVLNVALDGCNLIEASAGTGKTYSIGILALRLLLEKQIDDKGELRHLRIDEILMVTFTDAAVEELRSRIRAFVREAYDMATNPELMDKGHIATLVQAALEEDTAKCLRILKDALALIDEVSILTIHGFCNRTLGEFAFETQQLFDKEMISDQDELMEQSVNAYWRKNITTLPAEELMVLMDNDFSKDTLKQVVYEILDGKDFRDAQFEEKGEWLLTYEQCIDKIEDVEGAFISSYQEKKEELETTISAIKGKAAHKYFSPSYGDAESLWKLFLDKLGKPPKYYASLPQMWLDFGEEYYKYKEEAETLISSIKNKIYVTASEFVAKDLQERKEEKSLQSFDDLIYNLHKVITSDQKQRLVEGLNKKYKAVFIDEFQDTDKVQYDIFYEAFRADNPDAILFYIGDPKQSIYAFRKADLETYKKSKEGSRLFTMATNYRSTPSYVAAMNSFFTLDPSFFADDEIQYIEVEAPESAKDLGLLTKNGQEVPALEFITTENKDHVNTAITASCLDLLHNHHINGKKVIPSNIGVLALSKKLGADIKKHLNAHGIPAVVIDDTKVIETEEAAYVQYILEAFFDPSRSTIHKALLSPLFATSVEDIRHLDILLEQQRFQEAAKMYHENGVYAAIMSLLDTYNVKGVLLHNDLNTAQRSLSNVYQLAELCQKKVLQNQYDLEKLIAWLMRERTSARDSKEGFELRLESDEEAVKIVTIHKSKGLAYDILITPSLQLKSDNHINASTLTYQDEESLDYVFSLDTKSEELNTIYKHQKEKENRRLMYVNLTRAKYKTIAILNTGSRSGYKDTFMTSLLPRIQSEASPLFKTWEWEEQELPRYEAKETTQDQDTEKVEHLRDFRNSWRLLSYSMISKHGEAYIPQEEEKELVDYDQFIYEDLPRGAGLGNFLHYLFENVDFQNTESFDKWIERGEQLFGKKIVKEEFKKLYSQHINQVCGSVLNDGEKEFSLTDISKNQRLNELQFYFDIGEFKEEDFKQFEKPVDTDYPSYKGFFQGFIDLVFEHEGKYYILDWKSNYLGNSTEAYTAEKLDNAMTANNYHLQYFIYSIALIRFLKQRIPNFSYEEHFGGSFYLYLRGCREGNETGVFFHKPSWESLAKYVSL